VSNNAGNYFVMGAGVEGNIILIGIVGPCSPEEARSVGKITFLKDTGLPTTTNVDTEIFDRCETYLEAEVFKCFLIEMLKKK